MVLRNSLDLSNIPELCLLAIELGTIKFISPSFNLLAGIAKPFRCSNWADFVEMTVY